MIFWWSAGVAGAVLIMAAFMFYTFTEIVFGEFEFFRRLKAFLVLSGVSAVVIMAGPFGFIFAVALICSVRKPKSSK